MLLHSHSTCVYPTTLTNLDIRYNLYKFGAMHVEPLQRLVNLCILSVAFTGGDGDRQFLANMERSVTFVSCCQSNASNQDIKPPHPDVRVCYE